MRYRGTLLHIKQYCVNKLLLPYSVLIHLLEKTLVDFMSYAKGARDEMPLARLGSLQALNSPTVS